jgi:hypothetical protein
MPVIGGWGAESQDLTQVLSRRRAIEEKDGALSLVVDFGSTSWHEAHHCRARLKPFAAIPAAKAGAVTRLISATIVPMRFMGLDDIFANEEQYARFSLG